MVEWVTVSHTPSHASCAVPGQLITCHLGLGHSLSPRADPTAVAIPYPYSPSDNRGIPYMARAQSRGPEPKNQVPVLGQAPVNQSPPSLSGCKSLPPGTHPELSSFTTAGWSPALGAPAALTPGTKEVLCPPPQTFPTLGCAGLRHPHSTSGKTKSQ